jgi:hypothetical protein
MEGTLHKTEQGWVVKYFDTDKSHDVMYCGESLPVHPHEKVDEDAEGREVEYKIVYFWETELEEAFKVAELFKPIRHKKINLEEVPKSYLAISNQPPNSITLSLDREEPIIVIDEVGFKYKGELIEDAGEIYKLFKEFLKKSI